MTLSERTNTLSRASVQEPEKGDTPETSPEEETTVASWADVAGILGANAHKSPPSEPVKVEKYRRKKPWSQQTIPAIVLGVLMIAGIAVGIAAVIGLRYLSETFAAN